jgi:hypothetical protein
MSNSRRVNALRAIVAGAQARTGSQDFTHVDIELQEIDGVKRINPQTRKWLLEVLHGTRALDTALKEVYRSHGLNPEHSLGPLLWQLTKLPPGSPGYLTLGNRARFSKRIGDARNQIAHNANAFPRSSKETDGILSEIETCFVLTVR